MQLLDEDLLFLERILELLLAPYPVYGHRVQRGKTAHHEKIVVVIVTRGICDTDLPDRLITEDHGDRQEAGERGVAFRVSVPRRMLAPARW